MHGVGVIEAIEKKVVLGKRNEFYLISIINSGMKVMIPVANAEKVGIRNVISKRDVNKVLNLLKAEGPPTEDDWKLRYQNNIDKVKSGRSTRSRRLPVIFTGAERKKSFPSWKENCMKAPTISSFMRLPFLKT
jgi:RNA polymerase-interacting CarD/CdnL/TRCF family regulator